MEPEGSPLHSQQLATCPYPELAQSSPCLHIPHLCLGLPRGLFTSAFPTKTLYTPHPMRATCRAHLILLNLITRTILGAEARSLRSSLCSFLHSHVTLSLLGPNILLYAPFSNTLSLRSSPSVSNQVSDPYQTTAKIIVLYILIFKFLDSKLKKQYSAPNDSKHSNFNLLLISSNTEF